ncbi:hypothetical protein BZG36_01060 [Bifiguratus adelaidae]|uniref:Uncharacterized protein n=1 Tax=Bifiguratus adelaidae TaxID=1938954 RepID=A0A261Y683_9FUNG|nr:hypothetical protein BZG36_01060 [Bifiguratus adelaidae]
MAKINNAGIALGGGHRFWEQDVGDIFDILGTNINGLVAVTHFVLKHFMIPAKRGTILNVPSVTGLEVPLPNMGTDIRVGALRPGFVRTNFHYQRMGKDDEKFDGVFEGLEEFLPEDSASACLWILQQPQRISIKALDVVPSAQRSLGVVGREWSDRKSKQT